MEYDDAPAPGSAEGGGVSYGGTTTGNGPYTMNDLGAQPAARPLYIVHSDDQRFGQGGPYPQPIRRKPFTAVNLSDLVVEVDAALPPPEGGTMPTAITGAIATFRGPVDEVCVGDRVRREGRQLAAGVTDSIRVTEEPVRHGSVWLIRGLASGAAPTALYPFKDELVWITRARVGPIDPQRESDVVSARHLRDGV